MCKKYKSLLDIHLLKRAMKRSCKEQAKVMKKGKKPMPCGGRKKRK